MSGNALPPPPAVDVSALRPIAKDVWVIADRRVPLVPNIGIVAGEHSVLVIDTGMGTANGRSVLDLARSLAGDRKLYLTITHFHPEHGYGAEAFKGKATILYNRAQADDLAAKGEGYLSMFKGMGPAVEAALAGTGLVTADVLYDGPDHALDLGGRTVLLKSWGRAHTNGDQAVFLPRDGILFTGDLAEEKTFPIFPGFPPHDTDIDGDRWVQALDECLALKPVIVVPGHGDIGGPEILSDVRDYIVAIGAGVAAAMDRGESEDDMIGAIRAEMLDRYPDWHFPNGSISPSGTSPPSREGTFMTTVLVAMHYQNEVMHAAGKIRVGVAENAADRDELVTKAGRLLALARGAGIPVVSVRIAFRPDHGDVIANCPLFRNVIAGKAMIDGSWGAEFHDGLEPAEGEFVVKHTRVNAFYGSQLEEVLRVLGADHLVMAGVATNSVVLTTVACAADMGYEVTVVADACSSGNPALHESSLENMKLVADVIDLEVLVDRL